MNVFSTSPLEWDSSDNNGLAAQLSKAKRIPSIKPHFTHLNHHTRWLQDNAGITNTSTTTQRQETVRYGTLRTVRHSLDSNRQDLSSHNILTETAGPRLIMRGEKKGNHQLTRQFSRDSEMTHKRDRRVTVALLHTMFPGP